MTRGMMRKTIIFAIVISVLSITNDIIRYTLIQDRSNVIIYSLGVIPVTFISTYSFIKFYPTNSQEKERIVKRIFLVISIVVIILLAVSIAIYLALNNLNSYR